MTLYDTRIVHSTIASLAQNPGALAKCFEDRLRHTDPALQATLSILHFENGASFIDALVASVDSVSHPDQLIGSVRILGRRQGEYVWQPRRHAVIGQALIAALADTLGDDFTEDARQAWTNGYVLLAEAMLAATCNRLDLVA